MNDNEYSKDKREITKLRQQLEESKIALKHMKKELNLERKRFLSIFNSVNQVIYFTDPDTYEIVFANKYLTGIIGSDPVGKKCYKEFQGLDSPCEFCTNDIILKEKGKAYNWEHYNPKVKAHFNIVDMITKWPDGRDVRFELAINTDALKLTDEDLFSSGKWQKEVVESIGTGVLLIGHEMDIIFMNKQMKTWYPDIDKTKGTFCYKYLHDSPENEICSYCPVGGTFKDGQTHEAVTEKYLNNRITNFRLVSFPLINYSNKIIASVLILEDISERIQAKEALKESEAKYKGVFENTKNGISVFKAVDKGSDFVFWDFNRTEERINNIKKQEVLGRRISQVFPGIVEFGLFEVLQRVWKTGKAEHIPVSFYKDERIRGWRRYFVFRLPSGEILTICSDETKRMLSEESIHLNRVLRAVRNIKQLIVNKTDRITLLHGACEILTENCNYYSAWIMALDESGRFLKLAEAGMGNTVKPLIWQMKSGYFPLCIDDALEKKGVVHVRDPVSFCSECIFDKRFYNTKIMTVRLEHNGEVYGLLGVHVSGYAAANEEELSLLEEAAGDIGFALYSQKLEEQRRNSQKEQIKLERQLRQAYKMESIGTLASGISHDFNNILSGIISNTEIALFHELPEDSPARYSLEQALKGCHRGADLVKQILAFSRQAELELNPVRITPIIKEVLKLLRATLPANIEIVREFNTESDTILGNPVQIHQILMNICANAAYAMRQKGGVLKISLTDKDFGSRLLPDLKLSISDTGCGMEPMVMERIFDPYFSTKPKEAGTGMGLAVVHGIVKGFKGMIRVESRPGKGSTFHIFLPGLEDLDIWELEAREPIPGGHEHILFVDDELSLAEAGKRMLEPLGYRVSEKTGSIEALEAFRKQPRKFDLLITDMGMPDMTGDRLAEEVIRIRPDIPVILCTGFSELISEKKAKSMGICEFVMKPLIMSDMAQTIRKLLDRFND